MENLSEHRDRANKTDSNELRTTDPIHVWLREICQRWGNSPGYPRVPSHDSLVAMPNQRALRDWREALQIAIKPRLVGREPYGVRTEALLRLSRRPRTGL
jgi:hypothetical protein